MLPEEVSFLLEGHQLAVQQVGLGLDIFRLLLSVGLENGSLLHIRHDSRNDENDKDNPKRAVLYNPNPDEIYGLALGHQVFYRGEPLLFVSEWSAESLGVVNK